MTTRKRKGTSKASANARHDLFVKAYIANGENATQAYLEVNPKVTPGSAAVEGHRWLKQPKIQKAIERDRAALRARFALTTDRVVQEQARIVYFNPKKLLDASGKALPLHLVDDDTAAALSAVELTETEVRGKGKDKVVVHRKMKHRPYNKVSALNMVNKILRVYDKPPPPPPDELPAAIADPRETARRMAFLLARGAHADEKAQAKPQPKARKKLPVAA